MQRPARRAYTLVELLGVLSIAGVVALTAAPAVDRLARARHGALETETRRMLSLARAHAIATGQPTGLTVDPVAETLTLVRISAPGGAPEAFPGPTGADLPAFDVEARLPGAEVVAVAGGDGASGAQTLWFGYAGAPERRNPAGVRLGDWSQDATVTLSGGRTITIRRTTGAME
ncbi:MAG: Tfp pilus assembly protein FimT/FimU [Phycisphaerales bacterium]